MTENNISINIWDDYFDDGYVPEGEIQETYAYVESSLDDNDCQQVLSLLKEKIEKLTPHTASFSINLHYYDSAKVYPNLIGTEHEHFLYKRWQLEIKYITHTAREYIVNYFQEHSFSYHTTPVVIYSES